MEKVTEDLSNLRLIPSFTGISYNDVMMKHRCPWEAHVENPGRLKQIVERLKNSGIWCQCRIFLGRPASKEEICLVHCESWFSSVAAVGGMTEEGLKDFSSKFDSVYFCKDSFEAAAWAVGCGIDLVARVWRNELRNGFALLRPAGHHAGAREASGFCLFNNVAVSAKYALEHLGAKRILIVDWDVHHGQGTQDFFYEDPRVMYFSVHRYENGKFWPHLRRGNYDFIGSETGHGYNVNVPLNKFDPDLVLVSAGFDAVCGDPKGEMSVSPEMYGQLTHLLKVFANGKMILFLEGGYDAEMTARCVAVCINVLLGMTVPSLDTNLEYSVDETHQPVIEFTPLEVGTEPTTPTTPPEKGKGLTSNSRSSRQFSNVTCLAYDERMLRHRCSESHPECPKRLKSIYKKLADDGLLERLVKVESRKATKEEIELIHERPYIDLMEETANSLELRNDLELTYNSVFLSAESYDCALLAVGTLLEAVDQVQGNRSRNGLALPRPPGHHAAKDEAYGFCIFNNVAIATKYAQKVHGVKKILIFDWDVHHGDGSQAAFYSDPNVLYISLHRFDHGRFFPVGAESDFKNIGVELGKGLTVNVPWSGYSMGHAEYLAALFHVVLPICYEFNPDLVFVSAGFDAAKGDPLGRFQLTPGFFGLLTHFLSGLAEGRLILVLEGGYNLDAISNSVAECVKVLFGEPPLRPTFENLPCHSKAWETIRDVAGVQREYWQSLKGFQVSMDFFSSAAWKALEETSQKKPDESTVFVQFHNNKSEE